jgi:hypothetical protein
MNRLRFGLLLALLPVLAGCWGSSVEPPPGVEVSGKVQLADGSPLKGGTLVLRPVGGIHGASAEIQPDGAFTLVDPRGSKSVVPGSYQVYVLVNDPRHKDIARRVPQRYRSTEDGDSDVVVVIQDRVTDLRISLKR